MENARVTAGTTRGGRYSRQIKGLRAARRAAAHLVSESASFECDPLPDNWWHFEVKLDRAASLDVAFFVAL